MITLNDGRTELYQWDTGRSIKVDAECSQVHFSNKIFGRSLDVDVIDGVAKIPDILLQSDKDIIAWGFVGTPDNGYTKISKIFKVVGRNKPNEYVFTPTEQLNIQELEKRIKLIEDTVNPDIIKETVDTYLEENPITVDDVLGLTESLNEAFSKLTPRLYAPAVFGNGNDDNTWFEIIEDTRNNGMTNIFNIYIDGKFVTSESANGGKGTVDIMPFTSELNLGWHTVTATAVGGGFGIDFKESNPSEIRWYQHKSSSGSVSVTLEAGETSKTITIEGEYDILTVNGIDGLTDAVTAVVSHDDGSITVNYESDSDINIVIYYTISIE